MCRSAAGLIRQCTVGLSELFWTNKSAAGNDVDKNFLSGKTKTVTFRLLNTNVDFKELWRAERESSDKQPF